MTNSKKIFFNSYQQAFDSFDSNAIANHYCHPCLISDVDGLKSYENRTQLKTKFKTNCETMKSLGYSGSEYLIRQSHAITEQDFLIDIAWRVLLAKEPYDFRSFYVCKKSEDTIKIAHAVVYQGDFQSDDF